MATSRNTPARTANSSTSCAVGLMTASMAGIEFIGWWQNFGDFPVGFVGGAQFHVQPLHPVTQRVPGQLKLFGGACQAESVLLQRAVDDFALQAFERGVERLVRARAGRTRFFAGAFRPENPAGWRPGFRRPVSRITARSTTLRSSRTLPGQRWASSFCRAAGGEAGDIFVQGRRGMISKNAPASSSTSSPRSRSGGRLNCTTFSRWNKSSRNSPAAMDLHDVAVGGGDEADVDAQFLRAADARERAVLQKPQQLGLKRLAHVGDFVEKNRAAVGLLDAAGFLFDRAGERAFFVAEQFAFQQRLGNGRAVDADVILRRAAGSSRAARRRPVPCRCRFRRESKRAPRSAATVWIKLPQLAHFAAIRRRSGPG